MKLRIDEQKMHSEISKTIRLMQEAIETLANLVDLSPDKKKAVSKKKAIHNKIQKTINKHLQ